VAQTKRKRRSKHRGNAVGVVEARGRTSKPKEGGAKPSGGGRSHGAKRGPRELKPPSFQSALLKALVGGVVLFMLAKFGVLGKSATTGSALGLACLAVAFYTPIMYLTDRMIYKRKMQPKVRS
jgi:hypothetical protein